jgi:hypothetical protein
MTSSTVFTPSFEYAERYYDFRKTYGSYPRIEADSMTDGNTWNKCQEIAFKVIRSDLEQGWEVDQQAWGPSCIKHQRIKVGITSWDIGYWIAYILLSMITAGIGFFILPFVMGKVFIELKGVEVRLRRLKKT